MCEILEPLALEQWPLLRDIIKAKNPAYTSYCNWISNAIIWKTKEPQLDLQIYCPRGKYNSGTFVGIFDHARCIVVVFAFKSQGEFLRQLLRETRRLDFTKTITFAFVLDDIYPYLYGALSDLKESDGVEILKTIPGTYYYKSAKDCAAVEIRQVSSTSNLNQFLMQNNISYKHRVPEECYLRPLQESDVDYIHSQWPHRNEQDPESTLNYLKHFVTSNDYCLGLFLKEKDVLVSWALITDFHGLGMVQTREGYKRRGYGKLVSQAVAKHLGEGGFDSATSVVAGNTASEKMFASIGYQKITGTNWVMVKLHGNSE